MLLRLYSSILLPPPTVSYNHNFAFLQAMLQRGGEGCGLGGETGTFTPMYLAVVRKPIKKGKK